MKFLEMKSFVPKLSLRIIVEHAAVAGLYIVSALLKPQLAYGEGSPLSLPAAIALSVGLVLGYRGVIGVWIGALVVNLRAPDVIVGPTAALTLATGSALQMLTATALIRRFIPAGATICFLRPASTSATSTPHAPRPPFRSPASIA